ncbi:flagellar assembly factor FliW [Paenibacillus favisporus]|uniref:Flagellar assembly factor FliW n=1 Tax=Paenibacillus favisporus TaxID=221028 RepID=A0ABV2F8R8_9BACL
MNIQKDTYDIQAVPEEVFEFKNGIPGFEGYTKFVILPQDEHFSILQSLDDSNVAFIITDPFIFFKDYEFELSESDQAQLNISDSAQIMVRAIVTWGNDLTKVTANLAAPLVFNLKNKSGKQIVLYPTSYQSKHPLLGPQTPEESGND